MRGPVSATRFADSSCPWPPAFPPPAPQRHAGALFAGFHGTMQESDFCRPYIIGGGLLGLPDADRRPPRAAAGRQISRFPHKEPTRMPGSATTQGRPSARACARSAHAPGASPGPGRTTRPRYRLMRPTWPGAGWRPRPVGPVDIDVHVDVVVIVIDPIAESLIVIAGRVDAGPARRPAAGKQQQDGAERGTLHPPSPRDVIEFTMAISALS